MTGRLVGYGHRAPKIARRRAILFSVLLGISAILMIASATAPVAELQRGLAFAMAPFSEAVNGVGREVRSVVDAAAEIDRLRRENAALSSENARLEERNRRLAAEVRDLKEGRVAIEERARTDLGMIGANETFFQVMPADPQASGDSDQQERRTAEAEPR